MAKEDSQETTNAIVSNEPRLFVCDDKTSSAICGQARAVTKKKIVITNANVHCGRVVSHKPELIKRKRIKALEVLMDLSGFSFHDRPRHCR